MLLAASNQIGKPTASPYRFRLAGLNLMKKFVLPILLVSILATIPALGGVRHFTFLYEANTSAQGSIELENWVTWRRATGPGQFDQVDFRHELEYGVTDTFQASIYLADWFNEHDSEHSGFTFSDTAIELI